MKNLYTAFLCILGMFTALTQSQANNLPPITGNTIGSDQTICNGTTPASLTGSLPGGGIGAYTYQWQVSSTSAVAGFANIAGATAQGYSPGVLIANRWYRRIVTSGVFVDTSPAVAITVTPVITAASNIITGTQTICFNTIPATLTGPTATGGNGTYVYQWQSSPDNLTFTDIGGATATTYTPPALAATTWYKRNVSSGGCSNTSASIKVTVTPIITTGSNTIAVDQSICNGQTPIPLTGSTPTGATGAYTYLWESSTTSSSTGYSTAAGTSNGKNYSPLSLTQSTWFHRVVSSGGCIDISAPVLITVVTVPPGNPAVYGNGVWNVYGYSDNAFGTYAGFYTEPVLSFNTVSRYTTAQSPSYASGYQGCLIPVSNFSVSMKQTNFTPGNYQLNLNSLDDNLNVFLNGTQIYAHTCCVAAPINNIWTGSLGAADQMELRWVNFGSPSYLSMQFTPVTPAPLVSGSISQDMQVCYGEVPPAGFTSTAAPTSGCTLTGVQWQKSIDNVTYVPIAGATALAYTETSALTQTTWYRRMATDACNNSVPTAPVKVTVNVVAPGDPNVYGNNTWNVYLFQGTGTPGPYNTAIYKGYYTEPLLSFDSRNRWLPNASPSTASGYQGCVMNANNTWVDYKRTNFTPAVYQIDIPWHDDAAYLFINGIQVFSHVGCCDAHTNVWTGPLGPTDQVEFRISQGGGPSYEILTLTPVTPPALTAGSITPDQTICAGDVPPTPLSQLTAPTGGCTIKNYTWEYSTDNGVTWTSISGATAIGYTITSSIYTQTLYRRTVNDVCGNSAVSAPITISMNNSAPGNPAVFGNNTWNVYCFQDINYSIYAGYYTEPLLTFATTNRYPATSPPSTASGYLGCQLINTYYSVSMKRTGFTAGLYQIDVTSDDDYNLIYINGVLVSSLTYPTIQNNVWTGNLGPTDQIEVRWRNNAGPGQTGVRFTLVTATPLLPGSIVAYNPNLCFNDLPIINEVTPASGGCFVNYSWQSSIDGGTTWTTVVGATGNTFTASVSPTTNIQYRRVATDVCGTVAYTAPVSFVQTAGTVGNPSVYGNGVWNVYAYDANGASFATAQYLGYYVEPLLSFNSLNRWGTNNAPSDASGYQGCQVDQDNHWVSYRQTNFTPGTYQIDVTNHDDDGYLFVNGVQVWVHVGCCDAHTNVWTGVLGATDKVEFRWRENFGGSNGGLNFTLVTPVTTVNPGTIAAGQTICANTTPAAFTSSLDASSTCFVSYQWQSSPDNITWTDILGATSNIYSAGPVAAKTYFRRNAINSCGVSAVSNTIIVDVFPVVLTAGTIATDQTICKTALAATITATVLPTGGDGNYVYQWQSSLDNIGWANIAGAVSSTFSPGALPVTTYFRRKVSACAGSSSAISNNVLITVNPLTAITTQPANPSACSGGSTSVTVAASGNGLTYQWQVNTGAGFVNVTNGAPYSGATAATLLINPVIAGMNGYKYQVIINSTCGPTVTSNIVTLTVAVNPVITTQPANTTVCAGTNATFSINASGSGLTYQWQIKVGAAWNNLVDDATYSGTLTNTLLITNASAALNGNIYRCVLNTTCAGLLNSNQATLTVVAAPVNTIAADQAICSGINAANLTGSAAANYQWWSSTVSSSSGFVFTGSAGKNYNVPNPVTTTTYYQRIAGNGTCTNTSNVVTITVNNTPITITTQPAAQAICAGGTATFTATATGPGTLTYLWYENGVALADGGIYSGTATNTLTLTGATAGMNNNSYVMSVFASGCSASFKNTNAAILTTNNGPVILTSAPSFITCQGSSVQLNITASGIGLSYQWQVNTGSGWNNLSNFGSYSNVNGNSLRINPTSASMDGYQYQCIVTGTCSPFTATTVPTTMNVNSPVVNNSISNSQTLCAGTPAPFTGSTPTGGTGVYTYQWFLNTGSGWFAIAGATGINYASGSLSQTTQFLRQVSSGACASVNSTAITVTILPPTSTLDPSNITVCAGTNATFTVVATGSGLSYQWQVNTGSGWSNLINGASYTGVTNATLNVIAPPFGFNGYQYRCIVNGGCTPLTVTSNPATLTVNPVAIITSQPSNVNTCAGSNASYTVTATGAGLTYQWMEKVGAGAFTTITDGGIYSGSATANLTLTGVTIGMNNNQYLCVITLGACPVNSQVASLTVSAQPALTITNPATICSPATVDLTAPAVTAGSNLAGGILTYWNDITFTSPVLNPTAVAVSGTYYIRVATSAVCYDIKPVVVTISPFITNNNISSSQAICTGSTPAGLTGTAPGGGTSAYTYQWLQSSDNVTYTSIGGATNPNYNPGALVATTWYKRVVNSGTCTSTSTAVQITVVAYPTATISYAGSPFCATGNATVTQSGQTGGTYSAPAAVAINAATGTINLGASTAGTYTITYNFSNGTCNGSTTASVTINALPAATISYAGSPYCATGTANVTLTGTSGGTFTAPAGLVIDAVTGAVNLATSTLGTYTVTYTFSNGTCGNSTTASITINALPTAAIAYTASPYCSIGTAAVSQSGPAGGTYSAVPAGLSLNASTGAINLAASTPNTYTVTYSFSNGTCSNTTTASVTINPVPTVVITNPAAVCSPATVDITAVAVTAGSTAGLAFTYFTDAAGTIVLATPNAVAASGTYYIKGTTASGCSDIKPVVVTINPKPTVVITNPAAVCSPGTVDITAAAVTAGSTAGLTYTYFTNAAGTIVLASPNAVAASGTYYIKGTTASGCTDIKPVVVTINPKPTVVITNPAAVCSPASIDITVAAVTAGSTAGLTYSYFTDAAGTIVLATPNAVAASGTYYIKGTTAAGCADIKPVVVTINPKPTVVITNPAAVCAPGTVDLTAAAVTAGSTAGLSFTYFTNAAATIVLASPNAVAASGTYYIKGATASGCTDIQPVVVTINPKPTVVITNPAAVCSPGTVDVTVAAVTAGSTAGLTYTYFTDAAGTIVLATPNAVAASGTYYIKGTLATGCSDIKPVVVTVNPKPTVVITNPAAVCSPATVNLTAAAVTAGSTAGLAFTYFTNAAGTIVLAGPAAVAVSGTYYIKGTTAAGCSDIQPVVVAINPKPTVVITNPAAVCAPGTVDLTAAAVTAGSTAGLTYTYFTDAAGTIVLATPNAVAASGTYYIRGTTASGCSDIKPVVVTINPKPTVVITNPAAVCSPATVNLTLAAVTAGSTAGLIYTYFTDAAGTIALATPNAVAASGTYYIKGTLATGCSDIKPVVVTINPKPTVVITNPPAVCSPGTVDLTAAAVTAGSTAGLTFTYFTNAAGTIVLATPNAVAVSGTYYIKGTTAAGCTDIQPVVVTINPKPTVAITNPAAVCSPATVNITVAAVTAGSTAGLTFTYFTDAAGTIALATPAAVTASGTYYIKGSTASGCSDIKPVVVTINPLPVATISYGGSPYCATGIATPTQTGTAGGTYTAPAGASITAATGAINLATSTPGTYTVTYSFTSGGCSNSTTASVTIIALPTATIAYSGSPYCATGTATPTQTGTAGGTYTAPAGVSINAGTGNINLASSTPGTYTVTYSFSSGACSNTVTASITIKALPTATIAYSGSPYCSTGTANPIQTGTAGGIYTSTAGLNITAGTGAINLATSTPGTYTVTYSFTSGGCSNTTTASVTITALPSATITYTGSPYCATGTASPTQTGQAGGTYTAPAAVSITAATGVINLATSTPGTYTITYSFSNGTCSNTTTASITINALPTATINYSGSPYCATGTATPTLTGTAGGTYTSTAGLSITAGTGVVNLATSTAGTYTVTYSFTAGACSNTTTASITIKALPVATINYAGSPYCATGTATPTQTGTAGGTYTSTAGLNITAGTGVVNLLTSTPGTYTVTYTFTSGGCSNTTTAPITINALPTATIAYPGSPFCATGTGTPTITGTAGGTFTAPAGVSITAATGAINLATSTPGTYTITYTFANGGCSNTTTASVTINALPTATITYAGSPYCATGTATPTQTGTAGGTYTAPAGVSITAATGAINLAASTPGTYIITYSFTGGGCSNTTTGSVTINALPTATIAYAGSPYCATGTATPTQTGTAGGTYTAPAGVSITAATGVINLASSTPGTYTVTYSFSNGTCSNTTTASVTINALPTATINYAGSPYCATGTAAPTQTGTAGGTYSSTAGLNITAGTGVINLATSTPGTYTVTYSFTSGGCSNTTTASVTITALPTAIINYAGSPYCATGTATPTQTGTAGGTYTSTAGLNITAATGAVNLATSTQGTYTVTYSFTSGGCSNTTTTSLTISALPVATINYAGSPYCAIGTATVTRTGVAGGTYSAPAGVSITAATGDIDLAASTPGTYTVTYSFTSGGCSNTTTASITINALPTAAIAYAGSPYCLTGTATPTQTGTAGGTYTAPAGVSINAASGLINLAASTPGTYTITYSFSNGTCSNTTTTSVTINALPTATIAYTGSPYCATGTAAVTLTGVAGGTFTAPAGITIDASTGDINLITSTPGTYTITYGFSNGSCSNSTTTSIKINPLPVANISYAAAPFCAIGTATVTRTGTAGGTYSAPAGVSISAATGDINLTASTPGTYTITYSFTNGTCSNTATTNITINVLPVAAITYPANPYCATGVAIPTQTGQTGGTYSASPVISINPSSGDINLAASTPGTYTIAYTYTNGICSAQTTASITINALPTATIAYAGSPYCATGTATPTQTGTGGGTYTAPAGVSITAATGAIDLAASTPGTYTVTYSFSNGTCSNTTTGSITINATPTATIVYAGSPYCAGGTATVTRTGQAGGTYTAPAGVSINAATGDINLAASTGGTYTVTYSFTNGTCSNTATTSVTINAVPLATITYAGSPYCATGTATVTQTGQAGGTYSSTAGLNINAATGDVNLVTSTPGTYTVTYAFGSGVCSNSTTGSITINALPTATISYGGSPYCATGTATPTQTGTGGGTYTAPAGISINAATGIINPAVSTPGTYTITYSFSNGTCSNTTTASVTINALPTATINYAGSPYCPTGTATVTQTGTAGGTYTAPVGVSITAGTGDINLATSTPGTYLITYSFTNGTCSSTTTGSITINGPPTATINYAGSPYCATGSASVTQTGQAGGTYTAPAGVSINAGTGDINLATSTPGTYTVTYSFSNGTCSSTTTASVTIKALPTATIAYAGSPYCATGTATPTIAGTTGGTFTAPVGISIAAATGVIDLAASTPGTYTITYSFSNGTCSNTTTASVTINALPTATISYAGSPYCATGIATVTQSGTIGGTYTAPAGISINAGTGDINLVTSIPGTYTITYSFSNGTCGNTTTTFITINALPTATIAYAGSPYCATGTATVTQTGTTGGTYTAPAGVVINAGSGDINVATSTPGTYTITYSFTNGTCSNTTTANITINALPTATISYAGSPYCATGTATVTQTGTNGGTYSSAAGLNLNAVTGAINLATSTPGTYTVTYNFSNGTCTNSTTASVTIITTPTVVITNPAAVCTPSTVDLTAASVTTGSTAGLTFTYYTDATATTVLTNPNAVAISGTYYIKGSAGSGCFDIQPAVVTINALPTATIAYAGSPYCATGTATVTHTGVAGGTYTAPAGLTINAGTGDIDLAASTPGTYTVTYSFTNGTCNNSTTASVTINALPTATIDYAANPYCATGTATITKTGTAGGTYTAPAGVVINAGTGDINLATSTAGTYTITYTFSNGICSSTANTNITINALPTATIAYAGSPYCATGTATVTQTGTAGGTYNSTAGLSITAATGGIDLATSTPGTYTVTYSFSNGTCSNTTTTSITINALPTATIAYSGSPYCATGTATVTQTGTSGGSYTAPAGVTINAATGDINLATSTAGTYAITYTFSNGTCSNTATTSVTVNALPTATIAYTASPYCKTGTATATQTGTTGGTYSAPAGVSVNAGTGDIDLAASTAGTYTITYSFTNGTCSSATTASITINALPTAAISYAGSPYCATGAATVTQTGTSGGTYSAPAGVSINAATGDINLGTTAAGTYTITYSFTNGTCSNTTTTSVTISALPTAAISYPGSPYCAISTGTVTQTGQTGGTYTAPAGVVINASTGDINLVTSTPGTYLITYSFTNGICSNTTTTTVTINALPTAVIAYTGSPYCATGTATVTQAGPAGGTYSSAVGLNINSATGDVNLLTSTPGTYVVTYSFSNGVCSNTTTTNITINALPTATIAYTGSPYCATGTATVTQTGQVGGTYSAPAGIVINAVTGDINPATSTAGTYTITYTFSNGICSNTTTASITINALPTATIAYTGSPYCATGIGTVTLTGQTGGTYTAPAGVVINAVSGDINLVTSTPGTYTITYSFTNGICNNTTTANITINALPTAIIAYAGSPYCATGTATVTQTGQGSGTYSASAAVSINAATGTIDLASSTAGTYTITYNFTNGICSNTTTASVTINALPVATIAYTAVPYCAIGTATVTQTGQTGGVYTAPAGVVINAVSGDINLVTSTAGTYTVTYTFSNGICSNTTTASITINALPTATISYAGSPYCATGIAAVTQNGVTGGVYSAPAGLSINATSGDINLVTSTPGTYLVTYTFSNGTCSNSTTTSVTTNALPVAGISYTATPYCATGTATVTQTGVAGGFYTAPAGVSINGVTGAIDLSASTAGTYTVTYTFSNGTCNNTATTSITINALPTASITYTGSPYCAVGTASVSQAGQNGGTYTSTAGLVINPTTGSIDLVASVAGSYTVTYSFSNGICSNKTTAIVTINALPVATIAYTGTPYCTNGTAIVSLTGVGGGTYSSTAGLSLNAFTGDIPLATSVEGIYTVVYSYSNGICSNTTSTTITIKNPMLVVNNPPAACTPETINLTNPAVTAGSQAGLTYNYYQDNAGTVPVVNPAAVPTGGTYYIRGVDLSNGCSSNIQPVVLTINPKPTISAAASATDICKGTTIILSALSPGNTIDWVGIGAGNTVTATPMDSTTYMAIATTSLGCKDTAFVDVAVKPFRITLTANPDPVLAGTNTTLTTIGNFTYNVLSWSPDVFFTDQTALSQTILVKDTSKSFTVIAQSTDGCLDTATLFVNVEANLGDFFVPNSFSPNNDGNNDIFKVYGSSVKDLTMRVYNQWGELIFETQNAQNGWDGTWKGRPQAVGVYVYVAQVTFYNNVKIKRKGTINLIR